ncbi:MAG: hypothetical protein GYB64_14960 [Chloroflexi bacterium]|nr:hypothetical protein [Chloroflexota bacterium]
MTVPYQHLIYNKPYVTGDVLESILDDRWHIKQVKTETAGRALLYRFTVTRSGEEMTVRVMDSPRVRDYAASHLG